MVFVMGLARKSSQAWHIAGDAIRGRRGVPRADGFSGKSTRSGRGRALAQDTSLGPYVRFQARNEAWASVRASVAESSGATRSSRWFTRPRRLSSRLLSSGRLVLPTILQRRTPGASPLACSQRAIHGASLGSLTLKVLSSSVRSEASRRQVRSVPAHSATNAESRLRRGSGKRSHS